MPASQEEIDTVALGAWVLDSSLSNPTLDDIYRVGKSDNFVEAKETILKEITERELAFVYEHIELPLSPVLRSMERRGVLVDREFLKNLSKEYTAELKKIAARIYEDMGAIDLAAPRAHGEHLAIGVHRAAAQILVDDTRALASFGDRAAAIAKATQQLVRDRLAPSG